MGRAKELFMEIEEHGYDYLLKFPTPNKEGGK